MTAGRKQVDTRKEHLGGGWFTDHRLTVPWMPSPTWLLEAASGLSLRPVR